MAQSEGIYGGGSIYHSRIGRGKVEIRSRGTEKIRNREFGRGPRAQLHVCHRIRTNNYDLQPLLLLLPFIICLRYGEHEIRIGELAKLAGFPQVSLSHEIMPMARIVPRGFTACADAYLTPHIKQYLQVFLFKNIIPII